MKFRVAYNGRISKLWGGDAIATAVHMTLLELGHESSVGTEARRGQGRDSVLILIGAEGSGGVCGWDGPVIVYNFMELDVFGAGAWLTQFRNSARHWSRPRVDGILDYSPGYSEAFVEEIGVQYHAECPLGYHRHFEKPRLSQEYDIGFLGKVATGSRRELFLASVPKKLKRAIYHYQKPGVRGMSKWGYSEEDDRRALSSKIFLHVHSTKRGCNFPAPRVIQLGMSNAIATLTEECSWYPEGMLEGVHYEAFKHGDPVDMERKIWKMMGDEERTRTMAGAGYRWVREEWLMVDHLQEALEGIFS